MSNIIISKPPLQALLAAAHNIQALLDDGTLTAAWGEGKPDDINAAVSAFDNLAARARIVQDETGKEASPFLRYRSEILGHYETAARLRALVLNLWGGVPCNLSLLFHNADEHHTRIALECIASYTHQGENDTFFMTLASEIAEAANKASEVAA